MHIYFIYFLKFTSQFFENFFLYLTQALSGFLMMMTQNGKLLYISDNAAEYLGHSMVSPSFSFFSYDMLVTMEKKKNDEERWIQILPISSSCQKEMIL